MLSLFLNLPYSSLGIMIAVFSVPKLKINLNKNPLAIILYVQGFWWTFAHMKNARAMAIGNVVILGPKLEPGDLEHELVHIEQWQREPFIQIFLYWRELWKNGYRNNKYEVEAYSRAGNIYKGK